MNRDMERHKEFSRRAMLLGGGKFAVFLVFASRLSYLQIFEQKKFQTLSDNNRISLRLLSAQRGEILDRFGVPLAINRPDFRAFLIPEQAQDVEKIIARVSKLIPISDYERENILEEISQNKQFTPVLLKEDLSWNDMAKVELHLPELPGVSMEEGQMRSYPLGAATAHIIGYIGKVSKSEITDDPIMDIPGFRIGKSGLEKRYEDNLRGIAGKVQAEVNAAGREIRELDRVEGKSGDRVTLTLDSDLQMQVQEYLSKEKSASAVVMDTHTGEIYAMCSHPSFDPNVFSSGISVDMWEGLISDPTSPLTNKTIAGQYPPASTFKMITALAGLESGVINVNTRVHCPGYYMMGRKKFHCWRKHGHGTVNVVDAIRESCDVFFYEVGKQVGIEKIARTARKMGLGSTLGLDVQGETPGLVPDKEWKEKRFKEKWQKGETIISAIGQGYFLATPLQLAVMTARFVNGGKEVKPILLRAIGDKIFKLPKWEKIYINEGYLKLINQGMYEVVNNPRGTAYWSRLTRGYSMGGKTGTAQVRRITQEDRDAGVKNKDLPWKFRHHGLFVGYGPVDNPRYVTAVVVEHGVGGSTSAAPIAKKIMKAVLKRDPRVIRTIDNKG